MSIEESDVLSTLTLDGWTQGLARIEAQTQRRRQAALREFMGQLRAEDAPLAVSFLMGQLLPCGVEQRPGITPAIVRRSMARTLGLTDQELDSLAIAHGGLPEVAPQRLKTPPAAGTVKLLQVRGWMEELLSYAREPADLVRQLLTSVSPASCRYLLRILLGEPPLPLDLEGVLRAVADATQVEVDAIDECYRLTNDLEDTVDRAYRGRRALAQVHCRTGRPYRMQRVSPAADQAAAWEGMEAPAQVLSIPAGIRLQIHRRHAGIQLYDARLREVSRAFPELTAALEKGLTGTDDLMLEGLVWLPDASPVDTMQAIADRIRRMPSRRGLVTRPEVPFSLILVDATRLGREDLMDRPLEMRLKRLQSIVRLQPLLGLDPGTPCETPEELNGLVEKARSAGAVGVLVRSLKGKYQADLSGFWRQLSLDAEVFDLAVVGATFTPGGALSRLQLAARGEASLAPVGELVAAAAPSTVWQELKSRLQDQVMFKAGERWTLAPGIIVSVTAQGGRKSPRRPAGLVLAGATFRWFREDRDALLVEPCARLQAWLDTTPPAPLESEE